MNGWFVVARAFVKWWKWYVIREIITTLHFSIKGLQIPNKTTNLGHFRAHFWAAEYPSAAADGLLPKHINFSKFQH